jgi:hypothetical protein
MPQPVKWVAIPTQTARARVCGQVEAVSCRERRDCAIHIPVFLTHSETAMIKAAFKRLF